MFISYALSFVNLGIYWNNHHHLFQAAKLVDGRAMWCNMLLLFWLSLFPFGTAWMGQTNFAPIPTAIYGVVLALAGVSYYILVRALMAVEGQAPTLAAAIGSDRKGIVSVLIYIAAVPIALAAPFLAFGLYVVVAVDLVRARSAYRAGPVALTPAVVATCTRPERSAPGRARQRRTGPVAQMPARMMAGRPARRGHAGDECRQARGDPMPGPSRVTLVAVVAIVAILGMAIGPAAFPRHAAAAAPPDLCGLLTPDEIASALKVEAADGSGGEGSCSWYMGGIELDVLVDAGSLEAERAGTSGYTDVTVAGQPALLASAGDTWLIVGIDGGKLSLHLFSDPGTGVDVPAAVESLAAIAFGRMAALGVGAPTPVPVATAGPLCAILTADEVSAALAEQVTVVQSNEATDCDYIVDPSGGGGSLTLYQNTTSLADLKLSPFISGTDVTVAGQPGLVDSHNPTIYVETPAGWILEMHLFSDAVGNDAAVTALETLAEAALSRSSDFPLLVETPEPVPTAAADADLAALFPTTVGGQPFPVRVPSDDELTAYYEVAADMGLGMDDLTFATASNDVAQRHGGSHQHVTGGGGGGVLRGAALAGDMADPQQTPGSVANKAVIKVTDGPDAEGAPSVYIATSDDVIWGITADEPALTEVMEALPVPTLPPPSPEPSPAS